MKKGLKEFQKVFDTTYNMEWLALDLAQNLSFKYECAKPEYAKITKDEVHMAYGLTGMGKKHPHNLMSELHQLARALGYTNEDYIDGGNKRRGEGNCNIHILGQGRSITCNAADLLEANNDA